MVNKIVLFFILIFIGFPVFGQGLSLGLGDIRIELGADAGFHLFIRKNPNIASVLITESTRDPAMLEHTFAFRAREWNPINGDEVRLLNGVPLSRASNIFSLISSTPVLHPELGPAFHIFVPWILEYGHAPGRHGVVDVRDGAFLNIRTFALPFADYRGSFADNPFNLAMQRAPAVTPPPEPMPPLPIIPPLIIERPPVTFLNEAEIALASIAQDGGGHLLYAAAPINLVPLLENLIRQEEGNVVDIVLSLDTTASMGPYIEELRRTLVPMLRQVTPNFAGWRIGMVQFKDYYWDDEYLTRVIPFTTDLDLFQQRLNAINAQGGGDIPEAIYEGLYEAVSSFPWAAERRFVILISEAPPHPTPRGRITRDMVFQQAQQRNITISAILLAKLPAVFGEVNWPLPMPPPGHFPLRPPYR